MTKHNLCKHPLYEVWHGMKNRCYLPSNTSYKWYGKRGIIINAVWKKSFKIFYNWAIKNGYEKGLTIDRIDTNGNYTPTNCRFVNRTIQQINKQSWHNSTSTYIGVHKARDKWRSRLRVNGRTVDLGDFETEKQAAIIRDKFILENNLEHRLNILLRLRSKDMAKGGGFENDMSKEFSLYLTHMKTEDGVRRTEGSGSKATSKSKAKQKNIRPDMFGDITYCIPECKYWFDVFSIECKTGYAKKTKSKKDKKRTTVTMWSLLDLIDSQQMMTMFHEFWNQCLNDAIESKREPMLIFRRNRRTPCLAMHNDIFAGFIARFGNFSFNYINVNGDFCYLPVTIVNLRHFFDWTQHINHSIVQNYIVRQLIRRKFNEAQ
jgi:hypothetical protein